MALSPSHDSRLIIEDDAGNHRTAAARPQTANAAHHLIALDQVFSNGNFDGEGMSPEFGRQGRP